MNRHKKKTSYLFFLVLVVAVIAAPNLMAAPPVPQVLRYHVQHERYGDIGTYSNIIMQVGDTTTVTTEAHFKVSLLGIVVHREDSLRTERWNQGRLISFYGVTIKNGEKIELQCEARGNDFIISSPTGIVTAPADIHPANPWSSNFLESHTMMRVDTGMIEKVHITSGEEAPIMIDGRKVNTHEYAIDGTTHYKIWLRDSDQVPAMFSVEDESGLVTFTLMQQYASQL